MKQPLHPISRLAVLFCFLFVVQFKAFSQTQFEFNFLWEDNLFPNNPYNVVFDKLDRPYFYVSNDNGGILIYLHEYGNDPVMIDQIGIDNWEELNVMDITQSGNFLYLAIGSFFDASQTDFGMAIIDITDPENAFYTDHWISNNTEDNKGAASIEVDGTHAFLAAMEAGIYIFDVSTPNQISEISNYLPDPDFPVPNPGTIAEPNARGLSIQGDLLYVANDAGGLRVIDISDINNPNQINQYINEDLLGQTQQAYNNVLIHNEVAYIATDYCGLEVVDISDPQNIFQLIEWNPWGCESGDWVGSNIHVNQMSFIPGEEGHLLIVNGNDTELIAFDVSTVNDPIEIATYGNNDDNIRTWGLGVSDEYIMGAYYFTLFPWSSTQARLKLFGYDFVVAAKDIYKHGIHLSPNPSNGNVSISLASGTNGVADISIKNQLGSSVANIKQQITNGKLELKLDTYNCIGLHFIEIKIDGKTYIAKLILL